MKRSSQAKPKTQASQAKDPGRFGYRTTEERGKRFRAALVLTHSTVAQVLDELIDRHLDTYVREHRVNLKVDDLRPFRGKKLVLYR